MGGLLIFAGAIVLVAPPLGLGLVPRSGRHNRDGARGQFVTGKMAASGKQGGILAMPFSFSHKHRLVREIHHARELVERGDAA